MLGAGYMASKNDLPNIKYEQTLWRAGLSCVAGVDEAGRGALAGPVAVGIVVLPPNKPHLLRALACVRDSKQLTALQRNHCAPLIKSMAEEWRVGFASAEDIDLMGIVAATRLAATHALRSLNQNPDYLLTDFRLDLPEIETPQTSLVKGDVCCLSIAAASILAKTTRDALMCEFDEQYPGYGLGQNKGYGTQAHRTSIIGSGYSAVHRKSFSLKA